MKTANNYGLPSSKHPRVNQDRPRKAISRFRDDQGRSFPFAPDFYPDRTPMSTEPGAVNFGTFHPPGHHMDSHGGTWFGSVADFINQIGPLECVGIGMCAFVIMWWAVYVLV